MSQIPALTGPSAQPASGRDPKSMVILLHGYGSNGADLMGLVPYWRDALPDTVFLAPNAPEACAGSPGGFQWWAIKDLSLDGLAVEVRRAAPALDAFIDAQLAQYGLTDAETVLVGFSQGTMMSLQVGPRRAEALAGVVGYSGMLADPMSLAGETRSKPPVLLLHGDADSMVPVSAMHQADALLRGVGFDVATYVAPGLGHSIDETGIGLGLDFLVRTLAPAS